ncbi:MAG: beta-galactosidase [Lachnospiraceae bacterium]|nr:beta-galactosidase [Lachnospiraceae bacterium]
MDADIKWLDQPEIFKVNQVATHSDHPYYRNRNDYNLACNTLCQYLDNTWLFCYSKNAAERPEYFYKTDFDTSHFKTIRVPQHIELAGYDTIQYINTMYPWEGKIYRRPAGTLKDTNGKGMFSGASYNPVGSYIYKFDLQEGLKNMRIHLIFEGVEQAMYVWLNGIFVGYAEDSFTVSEFDISSIIKETDNLLAVEVHKRSTAAFLEDQDFFRFFGIFRSVSLHAIPETHIEDIWIKPKYDPETSIGSIGFQISACGKLKDTHIKMSLYDKEHCILKKECPLKENLQVNYELPDKVIPWDNQKPYLYRTEIEVIRADGQLVEFVPYKVGFRKIEIKDKVIYLNNKRLIINGVNRHEWNANTGRCITDKDEDADIACFRRNHINAVRTCHYPDRISWYYRCDEAGIYVMAETNLETHGSWQKMGKIEPSWNVPGDYILWRGAVLDRAKNNFEMFKNHPSVLFWSLGNESYAGKILEEMNAYYKGTDPDRLVHYEGVSANRQYEDSISDVESRMYAKPEEIIEYLENNPKKPVLLCEYMHNMGNSCGGMGSYINLLEDYEMYQGGFIWDYIDQAILCEDEVTGKPALRYGGDFDDRPSDYEFSGNGIVFADRTEKPAMQEVAYYYGKYK